MLQLSPKSGQKGVTMPYGDTEVVKVVAHEGNAGDWAAYRSSSYTQDYTDGSDEAIHERGTKLKQEQAEQLFPDWARRLKWRD